MWSSLNRSDAKVGPAPEDVVTALKQDIAVMVPSSSAVPASVNRGVAIILDEPRHPVSVALRDLADRVHPSERRTGSRQPARRAPAFVP